MRQSILRRLNDPLLKAALLAFVLPLIIFFPSALFLILGERVEGTVVAIKYNSPGKRNKGAFAGYWSRVVSFQTKDGRFLNNTAPSLNLGVGDRVGVYYLPGIYLARLDTFAAIWSPLVFAMCLQVVLLTVIGMLALVFAPHPKLNRMFPFGFTFLFLFLGAASAYPGYQRAKTLRQGVQTMGVIDLASVVIPNTKKYPIVRFRALNGRDYQVPSVSFNKGAKVAVVYLPERPQDALVLGNEEVSEIEKWWVLPLIFTGPLVLFSFWMIAIVGSYSKNDS